MTAALREFESPRMWIAGGIVLVLVVIGGSLMPASRIPTPAIEGLDKIQHLLGYAALSAYAVMLFARARDHVRAAIAAVALGIALEYAQQALTASRQADVVDVVFNALGAGVGWCLRYTPLSKMLQWMDAAAARRSGRLRR